MDMRECQECRAVLTRVECRRVGMPSSRIMLRVQGPLCHVLPWIGGLDDSASATRVRRHGWRWIQFHASGTTTVPRACSRSSRRALSSTSLICALLLPLPIALRSVSPMTHLRDGGRVSLAMPPVPKPKGARTCGSACMRRNRVKPGTASPCASPVHSLVTGVAGSSLFPCVDHPSAGSWTRSDMRQKTESGVWSRELSCLSCCDETTGDVIVSECACVAATFWGAVFRALASLPHLCLVLPSAADLSGRASNRHAVDIVFGAHSSAAADHGAKSELRFGCSRIVCSKSLKSRHKPHCMCRDRIMPPFKEYIPTTGLSQTWCSASKTKLFLSRNEQQTALQQLHMCFRLIALLDCRNERGLSREMRQRLPVRDIRHPSVA